jgi:hypothetical protein
MEQILRPSQSIILVRSIFLWDPDSKSIEEIGGVLMPTDIILSYKKMTKTSFFILRLRFNKD